MQERLAFPYRSWAHAAHSAARKVDGCQDAITPFGFEVTGDQSFLFGKLTRFFVYLAVHPDTTHLSCETAFTKTLLDPHSRIPDSVRNVRFLINSNGHTIRHQKEGGSLYIQGLSLPPRQDLYSAYGRYIATAPLAILRGNLKEMALFGILPSARRYIFQLTVSVAHLFQDIVELSPSGQARLVELIGKCPDRDPVTGQRATAFPSTEEKAAMEDLILPIHRDIKTSLDKSRKKEPILSVDFHSRALYRYYTDFTAIEEASGRVLAALHRYPASTRNTIPPTREARIDVP